MANPGDIAPDKERARDSPDGWAMAPRGRIGSFKRPKRVGHWVLEEYRDGLRVRASDDGGRQRHSAFNAIDAP